MDDSRVLWVCIWACILMGQVRNENYEERVVNSPQGPVRGYKRPEDNFFAFYGIPYATAPSGSDKFKAPLPAPEWVKPFDAVDKGVVCPQAVHAFVDLTHKSVQEDCLIANVYVPETSEDNLPVVVYIHGGGYHLGYGDVTPPKYLVKNNKVIAINFNYRLGIRGFLCLGTKDVPGNAGMKDQIALLRWVKNNIASYGGNPEDVTIAGYSAGASAVDLIMLSESARGLFNKIIAESAASLAAFTFQTDPLKNAKLFAKSQEFDNIDNIDALENFYTSADNKLLVIDSFFNLTDSTFLFSPCKEVETEDEAFLTDTPYNILKGGNYKRVPILYGFTDMEGLLRVPLHDSWKNKMNENFVDFLPLNLKFTDENEKAEVSKRVREFYFGDNQIDDGSILHYIDYFTDVLFAYPILRSIQYHLANGHDKIYLYQYNFVDDSTQFVPHTNVKGAGHCAQTTAAIVDEGNNISEEYKAIKSTMRELWLNFIINGSPVPAGSSLPEWPPTGANGEPHMSIGHTLELRGPLLEARARFWDFIYDQYYCQPVSPAMSSD